jgi:hypothetical protein
MGHACILILVYFILSKHTHVSCITEASDAKNDIALFEIEWKTEPFQIQVLFSTI